MVVVSSLLAMVLASSDSSQCTMLHSSAPSLLQRGKPSVQDTKADVATEQEDDLADDSVDGPTTSHATLLESGNCEPYCSRNTKHDWSTKCIWKNCNSCSECSHQTEAPTSSPTTDSPSSPAPAPSGHGGSGGEEEECTDIPVEKPDEPTLCTADNKGCCDCGQYHIKTYVFWTEGGTQRCFHAYNWPSTNSAAMPVVLHMDGYGGGSKGSETGGDMGDAAKRYGFVSLTIGNNLKDGAGGFGLEFGNRGIANDKNPTPCSRDESREIEYLDAVFKFIADNSVLDATKVYTEGFSQNSMFAVYTAVCFAEKVAGTWQGGSGQSRTGSNPVAPGKQAQCSFDSFAEHGSDCCDNDFCVDCQYWPVWPKTCSNKIVDCIAAYTDDTIACGSDWNMYEAMVEEGNDARLLSFPVPAGDNFAGHKDPKNKWAWFAGCTGIVPSCSTTCEASFSACVDTSTEAKSYEKFAACESTIELGSLTGCTVGCAPTLGMLRRSEEPVVTLSEGKFGTMDPIAAAVGSAPPPDCKKDFGPFTTGPGPKASCTAPADYTAPAISPSDIC